MHQGCGLQLAYKIIKDSGILSAPKETEKLGKARPAQLFISPIVAQHVLESVNYVQLPDPAAAPSGSIAMSDDLTAREHMSSFAQAKDLLFVCVNVSGKPGLAKRFGIGAWSATASLAFYDDLVAKLQKAAKQTGLRFVEILTPCPKLWRSEPANTVEIARQAVETGLWPLYELDHGRFTLSYKPPKLAAADAFASLQKLIVPDRVVLEKSWRLMTLGKPFEAE
ncbi:MAG: hypothetical protein QW548_02810 [Candidatus Aenigmatarchaeota archaeon]